MAKFARQGASLVYAQIRKSYRVDLHIRGGDWTSFLAGFGLGSAGTALYTDHSNSAPQPATENPDVPKKVEDAVRNALERNEADKIDPELTGINKGSIVVELDCHTEQSFLRFMKDFEKGKIKHKLEKEFGKIGFKEEIDVTITNRDEVQQNVNAIRLKDADCLIECMDENERVKFRGTGFYYGDGWVMIVADNVQDDDKDDETFHSYLSEGKFRVLFYVKGKKQLKKEYTFSQRKRMAFVHHLNSVDDTDFKNKDIWMVKLGNQYECSRNQDDINDWEKKEKEKLNEIFPGNFGLAQMAAADPKEEDDVYVVYNADDKKSKLVKEMKIRAITKGTDKVPMLLLAKKAGASGCPVMLGGECQLVGLHVPGDEDGEAEALLWKNGIQPYIQKGVEIITNIGTYLACKSVAAIPKVTDLLKKTASDQVENEKKNLESTAKNYQLTIYLKNGEIFKGLP